MKESIKEKAKLELSKLSFPNDWDSSSIEERNSFLSRDFRNNEYFTDREYEEDDDFPRFTGKEKVLDIARRHFSEDVLSHYDVSTYDQEKSWFTVQLNEKKQKS